MSTSNIEFQSSAITAAGVLAPARSLLRFTTAGSVDDGKSTLIGRLLYDSQAVYEDQIASVRNSRINRSQGPLDFSLLTDGLRAEREQGITIDVAYRYFSTPRRKFIIADTPGHDQYTRNMATGASTADAAIVLFDATKGVQPQSRRHSYIASLLGIQHVIAAVNKMDLVAYSRETFKALATQIDELGANLGIPDLYVIPISALEGDNVVRRSSRLPWFEGPPLLRHLEEIEVTSSTNPQSPFRFPIQYVIRPDANFRGFAGVVESGQARVGQPVRVLPSGVKTRIAAIVTYDGDRDEAASGEAVTLKLENEVDLSRGDLLVSGSNEPWVSRDFVSNLVWMHPEPLDTAKLYLLKHTTRTVRARVSAIAHRVDINSLQPVPAATLSMNDIARVEINTTLPLFFDRYRDVRSTGSFILIDPLSNATVAAGMIEESVGRAHKVITNKGSVTAQERRARNGHGPAAIWIEARPGVAELLERALFDDGWNVQLTTVDESSPGAHFVVELLHKAGAVALFSSDQHYPVFLEAIGSVYPETSTFVAAADSIQSEDEFVASLLEELRSWRRRDQAEVQV
jgi:sulfate adenylyltransferase large subunit